MKFSCIISICPLVIISAMAVIQMNRSTFDSCNPDEWIMTNTSFQLINGSKIIIYNITYKEKNNSTIYRIRTEIDDCDPRQRQSAMCKEPIVQIDNVNCNAQNLSMSDQKACQIGNELGKSEKQKDLLNYRYGDGPLREVLSKLVFCIDIKNVDISWNDTDSELLM